MLKGMSVEEFIFETMTFKPLANLVAPKDIDDGAPDVWHRMVKEGSADSYIDLDDISRVEVDRWKTQRANLLQIRMQQEMVAKLEEHSMIAEPCIPFVKVLVKSDIVEYTPSDDPMSEEAMLTVWRPLSEQLDSLQEGMLLRVKNLDTKTRRFSGLRQFSGSNTTPITILPPTAHQQPHWFSYREYSSMFRLQLSSKRLWKDTSKDQCTLVFDVLGIVLKVKQCADRQLWSLYLTDESNLLLRVQYDATCGDLDSFLSSFTCDDNHTVVGFHDLRTMPFDFRECCSVAQYRGTSHFTPTPPGHRAHILHQWSQSDAGRDQLQKQALYETIGVKETFSPEPTFCKAIGYITGFSVLTTRPQLLLHADCGELTLHTWRFPLSLISSFAGSCDTLDEFVVLNAEEEIKMSQLTSIGRLFRARQNLYCFSLQSIIDSSVDFPGCLFEVSQISTVDTRALAALYPTLLQ
jgi:hypothetical protein